MSRVADTYTLPAGTLATPNTVISSARYNAAMTDLQTDANAPRPVVAGGTGADNADEAAANLGLISAKDLAGTGAVGGTANAITLITARGYDALTARTLIAFKAISSITGPATFKLDDLDAKPIRKVVALGDVDVNGGDILAGGIYWLRYDLSADNLAGGWIILNPSATGGFQVGDYLDTVRTPSSDWLRRNGALYLISSYPELAALLPALPDGFDWQIRDSGITPTVTGLCAGEGKFIGVGQTKLIISDDGRTWTTQFETTTEWMRAVVHGSGIFVVIGSNQGYCYYSPEGETWTTGPQIDAAGLLGLTFLAGLNLFVACGVTGKIYTSPDAVTWTSQTSGTTEDLWSVRALNGVLVCVGENGTILTSVDAVTWTPRTSGVTSILRDAAFHDGIYIVVGDGGVIRRSTTLGTWVASVSGTAVNLLTAVGSDAGFLAAGSTGTIRISGDGETWAASPSGLTGSFASSVTDPNDSTRFILGMGGQKILDGIRTLPTQFRVPDDNPTNGWIKAVS